MKPYSDATAPGLTLHAGPLLATFDRGELRWVRLQEVEVLRGIYPAVRGPAWQTIAPRISALRIEQEEEGFRVGYDLRYEDGPLLFTASVRIDGAADGTVRFEFRGRAGAAFLKNRIGLCVLHPSPSCAGRPIEIDHGDGRITRGSLPKDVSPHQPFLDIRAIRHGIAPGRALEVRFEGEWFEMEDQRNWSDASFKTYSTPLSRPFPARMEEGEEVHHTVTLRLVAVPSMTLEASTSVGRPVEPMGSAPPLMRVGLDLGPADLAPSVADIARLRALRLDHLRIALGPEGVWGEALLRAAETSRACGVPLEVVALLGEGGGLERLAEAAAGLPVSVFLVFDHNTRRSDPALLARARRLLGAAVPGVRVGGGAAHWFADLNRNREAAQGGEVVSFALCPQAHARDESTILENLQSLSDLARTARTFAGSVPLVLSPLTLGPREEAPDPRLATEFGATWLRGILAAAREAGFWSVSLSPGLGPAGLASAETPAYRALLER